MSLPLLISHWQLYKTQTQNKVYPLFHNPLVKLVAVVTQYQKIFSFQNIFNYECTTFDIDKF